MKDTLYVIGLTLVVSSIVLGFLFLLAQIAGAQIKVEDKTNPINYKTELTKESYFKGSEEEILNYKLIEGKLDYIIHAIETCKK